MSAWKGPGQRHPCLVQCHPSSSTFAREVGMCAMGLYNRSHRLRPSQCPSNAHQAALWSALYSGVYALGSYRVRRPVTKNARQPAADQKADSGILQLRMPGTRPVSENFEECCPQHAHNLHWKLGLAAPCSLWSSNCNKPQWSWTAATILCPPLCDADKRPPAPTEAEGCVNKRAMYSAQH